MTRAWTSDWWPRRPGTGVGHGASNGRGCQSEEDRYVMGDVAVQS